MLISYNWIKQFIPDLTASPSEVKEKLSLSLAEVEELREIGNDFILEIENKALSHRADLFGQLGLAREIAAIFDLDLKTQPVTKLDSLAGRADTETTIKISMPQPELSQRYSAVILRNIEIKPSPEWLKKQLEAVNVRSISNIVDVTNYLMYKYGQPLHAFDLGQFADQSQSDNRERDLNIEVRLAKEAEILVLLDDSRLELTPQDLVIAHHASSNNYPIALAGVMGGKSAEISNDTTDILLESANFDMFSIRSSSRRHGIRSEASLRMEKGIDPEMTMNVLQEAVEMITGSREANYFDVYNPLIIKPTEIEIDAEQVNYYLNTQMPVNEITRKLKRLGFETKTDKSMISASVPSFRKDVKIKEDLYEEIGRLYDYNQIEITLPNRSFHPAPENRIWDFKYQLRDILVKQQLSEVLNYSFVDRDRAGLVTDIVDQEVVLKAKFDLKDLELENPVAPEFAFMRSSLIPSLQTNVIENAKWYNEFGIFEIGLVVHPRAAELPIEPDLLALVYYNQSMKKDQVLRHTKGLWKNLLSQLNITNDLTALIPIEINLGSTKGSAFGYEIEVTTLYEQKSAIKFQKVPVSPSTMQDISFFINETQEVGEIFAEIENQAGELLQRIELQDVFQNEKAREEKRKSITIRMTFQDSTRSLADKEINPIREEIEKMLKAKFDAEIR